MISIHALREEGDRYYWIKLKDSFIFLSTPSARRATKRRELEADTEQFLSTPSARRATMLFTLCW